MKPYDHLFFDLDHTLWDFRSNSRTVLRELHAELGLAERGVPDPASLIEVYEEVNEGLWKRMESGSIGKEVLRVLRFRNTLLTFGVNDTGLARMLGEEYLERTPRRNGLFPGAMETLRTLRPHYGLHIITNGFTTTQTTKLAACGIHDLFDTVITSELAGAAKPDPRIFHRALRSAGALPERSLMIGDSITADMAGARAAGMDQAHFHPEAQADPQARFRLEHLSELPRLLGH